MSKKDKKGGRPNKYYTHIEPRLDDIRKLCLTMTDKQIAQIMGVGWSTFKHYKSIHKDLQDAIKRGRDDLVTELKSTLIKKAKGYMYEETETIYEHGKEVKKVVKSKYAQPDTGASHLLLKNYDKENWANDPQMLAIRKEELELRKQQIENNDW